MKSNSLDGMMQSISFLASFLCISGESWEKSRALLRFAASYDGSLRNRMIE